MSIIHRSHRGANERNPRDHAGPAPADDGLGGFEERLLAEFKVVIGQREAAGFAADRGDVDYPQWPYGVDMGAGPDKT